MAWYEASLLNAITLVDTSAAAVAKTIARTANADYVLVYDLLEDTWSGRRIDVEFLDDFRTIAISNPSADIGPILMKMPFAPTTGLTSAYRVNVLMSGAHELVVVGEDNSVGVLETTLSSATPSVGIDRLEFVGLGESALPPSEPGEGKPSTTAWPVIDCPAGVVARQAFEVEVGIGPDPSDIGGTGELTLPDTDFTLQIEMMVHGFEVDGGRSFELEVTEANRFPVKAIHLTPVDDPALAARRTIGVLYRIAGEFIGFAERIVEVTESTQAAALVRRPVVADLGMEPPDPARDPVDLEIVIKRGNTRDGGALEWSVESRWTPEDRGDTTTNLGSSPASFRDMLLKKTRVADPQAVFMQLVGIGKLNIAGSIPGFVKEAIAGALAELDTPPTVLLISDDPYVPWELAVLGVPESDVSPFLGAQVALGRWTGSQPRRPESEIDISSIAVVSGDYEHVPGWSRLEHAENEAKVLTDKWNASSVDATFNDVVDCLRGRPPADVIHFALHGKFGDGELSNGLVLIRVTAGDQGDKKSAVYLDEAVVSGLNLERNPFVFLNACQVGASSEMLGEYSGLANGFLFAGARAVMAPLWSVDDGVAEMFALEFYEAFEVDEHASAAEILRASRARVTESALRRNEPTASPTRLAYQLFGHPGLSLRFAMGD